jgi:hypothetical protein
MLCRESCEDLILRPQAGGSTYSRAAKLRGNLTFRFVTGDNTAPAACCRRHPKVKIQKA